MIGSLLFFALAGTQQGCKAHAAQGRQPHPQAGVAGVSGGNGGGGGLCGSGQLGHGLGPQHLAAHGAGVGLDALTLRGGRRGDLALALRMLGVHGEGDGNGVAEAVGGRQGLDALGPLRMWR